MISISMDETYHIKSDGTPLYNARYKRVMSFHNGIAPVENDTGAFFIDKNNNKLFNRYFEKAYGFYENKAGVKDKNSWLHIDIKGNELYSKRYQWVGNFSENRCVVRSFDNNYFHIDEIGKRVYKENYSYTGDYKYSIAVVINKNGKATHIDKTGKLLHGIYFDELNIFHKGYAIAKDKNGYFHINKHGKELYQNRYKKLEDFYNGYALATTFDNAKIILSESDFIQSSITNSFIDKDKIINDLFSYFEYQILFAILKLDILKLLEEKREIALPILSQKLIFRWLRVKNIIDENHQLTTLGKVIENDLKALILYWQDLPFKNSAYLTETLINGDENFSKLFDKPYFDFLKDNPNYLKLSQSINNYYSIDYTKILPYLCLKNEKVCDIGGGNGKLLEEIKSYYPDIKTLVADKYITNAKNNKEIDFFKEFKIEADIFILSRVLHDWNDKKALKIIQNISNIMNKSSLLYIFETIVPSDYRVDKGITLSFHLLNFLGGYERTIEDFKILFQKANLKIIEIFFKDELISLIKVKKI